VRQTTVADGALGDGAAVAVFVADADAVAVGVAVPVADTLAESDGDAVGALVVAVTSPDSLGDGLVCPPPAHDAIASNAITASGVLQRARVRCERSVLVIISQSPFTSRHAEITQLAVRRLRFDTRGTTRARGWRVT
jgi:hypothetical protein